MRFLLLLPFVLFSAAMANNLLLNPDFKPGAAGVPQGWSHYATGLPVPEVVTLSDARRALYLNDTKTDAGGGLIQRVPCSPGTKYELSCEVLIPPGATAREVHGAMIQAAGLGMQLRPGKNVLGIVAPPEKKTFDVYLWTLKSGIGQAYLLNPTLKAVEQFGPDTAVNGKRPNAPTAAPLRPVGIMINPEFAGTGKVPDGWQQYSDLPPPQRITLADGSAALAIYDDDPQEGTGLCQVIPVKPNTRYLLSAEAVSHPQGTGADLAGVAMQINAGKEVSAHPLHPGRNAIGLQTAADTKQVTVYIYVLKKNRGKGCLKNVRFEEVKEFPPETRLPARPSAAKAAPPAPPDGIFVEPTGGSIEFTLPKPGIYQLDAVVTSPRHPIMTSQVKISVDNRPWTRAMLRNYNPMNRETAFLLLQRLTAGKHTLRFDSSDPQLGDQVKIHGFQIYPYRLRPVPKELATWTPPVVPPPTRPRILVTQATLPAVRRNLAKEPNKTLWEQLQKEAANELTVTAPPNQAVGFDGRICKAVRAKFFAYLMTGERKYADSGKKLLLDYLRVLDFVRDNFYVRWYGEILYSTALAYDWGYEFFTPEERAQLRDQMDFLAHTQEVGYPPFGQPITIGHGNERQIQIDLMAMAVAIYDEDPTLYRYCTYQLLGILVPERVKEFESGRHTEGAGYGQFRLAYDLYSALHFKMFNGGQEVFHPNIKDIYTHWLYATLPDGTLLNDGDGFTARGNSYACALAAAYSGNPLFYGEWLRLGGLSRTGDPEQMLAWFDPNIKPQPDRSELPLTRHQPGVLSSLNCRTGWNSGKLANDAIVEFNAKEFNLASHSHRDAGSFQIAYRGLLAGDIGQYRLFGVPYDSGFGKRTVSHSAMLVHNPAETMVGGNDGGQKPGFLFTSRTDFEHPERRSATTLAVDFGPDAKRPLYNVLKTDLTQAYPAGRLQKHLRSFYFLNFNDPERPGAVIVADRVESPYPKYFQIATPMPPQTTPQGLRILSNRTNGLPGQLHVAMLRPDVKAEILTGNAVYNVFGKQYTPPQPSRSAYRAMFPAKNGETNFTSVLQIAAGEPLPVEAKNAGPAYVIRLHCWTLGIAADCGMITREFAFDADGYVLLADLTPGEWSIENHGHVTVQPGKHTAFLKLPPGRYRIRPGKHGAALPAVTDTAIPTPVMHDAALLDGRSLPGIRPHSENGCVFVPVQALAKAAGCAATDLEFHDRQLRIHGRDLALPVREIDGQKMLEASTLAALLGLAGTADADQNLAVFSKSNPAAAPAMFVLESSNGQSPLGLFQNPATGWSHNSPSAYFAVRLVRPQRLKGLTLDVHSASLPMRIESSEDGKNWTVLDERITAAGKNQRTQVRFARPVRVDCLRFRFSGTPEAPYWNALNRIELEPDTP